MDLLYKLLVVVHLLGMAALVGSYLTVVRRPKVLGIMRDAAGVQLLSGLALVGLVESDAVDHSPLDHTKITVKLLITLVILVLAIVGNRRSDRQAAFAHAIGILAITNVLIAVLWT